MAARRGSVNGEKVFDSLKPMNCPLKCARCEGFAARQEGKLRLFGRSSRHMRFNIREKLRYHTGE